MNIRPEIAEIALSAADWRRAMHQNPGMAYDESYASNLVKSRLREWGIEFTEGWGKNPSLRSDLTGVGGHGVVAIIHGKNGPGENGKTIGLRADMDALPITEVSNPDWSSQTPGVMHACGHDGHTATLLSVAKYFSKAANRNFKGTLKLIFQPAEEGAKGANAMINEKLFEEHPMDAVFALHNWPSLPAGKIAVHPKHVMAASDYFHVDVIGEGAHGAMPELANNAMLAAAKMVGDIHSHKKDGAIDKNYVTSVCYMNAGDQTARAIIPGSSNFGGTIRYFNPDMRQHFKGAIEGVLSKYAAEFNVQAELKYSEGSPATINDPEQAAIIRAVAEKTVGAENVIWDGAPEMTAEDFGFMLEEKPGCYFWVGQADPAKPSSEMPLHNDRYDFNDDTIATGAEVFVKLVEHRLG